VSPRAGVTRIRLASTLAVDTGAGARTGRELGSRKSRTLLALLAASRGSPVATDRIVEALWHDAPPADPAANVATLVSRARRVVGPSLVVGVPGAYALGGEWSLDVVEAEQWCTEAATRLVSGEHALADSAAAAALLLLGTDPALLDEGDDDWVVRVRTEVDELRRTARHHRVAALLELDPAAAVRVARAGVAPDGYDERAVRDLMRALSADGQAPAALTAYDRLARRLRDELGADPDRATADLHLAVLREAHIRPETGARAGAGTPARQAPEPVALVGRESEVAHLRESWARSVAGESVALQLVVGEGGIGKTRLLDAVAEVASTTGGQVLRGRCHPAERSLFLQPVVDAVRPVLAGLARDELLGTVRDHEGAWVTLVPDLAGLLPAAPVAPADRDLLRRAAYDAVAVALRRMAVSRPVCLVLDDLQDAGAATVDLLGYLAGRLDGGRVLLVGAVRTEDAAVAERLGDRAERLHLGPLGPEAVDTLAAAAGLGTHGPQVMARTAGHTLSVVESLRALASGETGIPATLSEGVLARVARLPAQSRAVVEAGAVLRRRLDPRLLAGLTEVSEVTATRSCEDLTRSGLFTRAGAVYEFANDLFQECVHAALPEAVAAAYHRKAADLTSDRPELMASHADAVGDRGRAARGWLLAGEEALRRAAVEDARSLVERCLATPGLSVETRARALLVRGRVHEAGTSWSAALQDIDAALAWARTSGERRLELAALRARGGDAAVGAQLATDELLGPLDEGARLAADLGDRGAEADFGCRTTVLEASRLRLASARARADRVLARARASGLEDSVVLALDGLKTVAWYLGDTPLLAATVRELEPLVRARDDSWLIQWVVFEGAFVPAASDDWPGAHALVDEARDLNARSGFPAYAGYLRAYEGWLARLAGRLDQAQELGSRAVQETSAVDHPWWHSWAAGLLAATLVDAGDGPGAERIARAGMTARRGTARPGRLLCAAALAAVTGELTRSATDDLSAVDCPPGRAWVLGADAYLLLAGAATARGDTAEAVRILAPLRTATAGQWPAIRRRVDAIVQSASSTSRAARAAPSEGTGR
jgi:DNA-binding SARP family transcriptional activator/tetratricopeptide (TPR) repeat protein